MIKSVSNFKSSGFLWHQNQNLFLINVIQIKFVKNRTEENELNKMVYDRERAESRNISKQSNKFNQNWIDFRQVALNAAPKVSILSESFFSFLYCVSRSWMKTTAQLYHSISKCDFAIFQQKHIHALTYVALWKSIHKVFPS